MSDRYRVGNHYPIHIYEGDRPVATAQTPEDARAIVDALNAASPAADALALAQEAIRALMGGCTCFDDGEFHRGDEECPSRFKAYRLAEQALAASQPAGAVPGYDTLMAKVKKLQAEVVKWRTIAYNNTPDHTQQAGAPVTPWERHTRNLLARIHGDGGHYTEAHGVEQAVADADRIVAELYAQEPVTLPTREQIAKWLTDHLDSHLHAAGFNEAERQTVLRLKVDSIMRLLQGGAS